MKEREGKFSTLQEVVNSIATKKDLHKQRLDHYQKIIQFLDNFDIDELETKRV